MLARLLAGERLTSLDTVYVASTTRLGAVVFYLANDYGWQIQSIDKSAGCNDGRVAWVSEYFMPAEIIARAMAAGAGEWCVKIRAARNNRRAHAVQARREATSPWTRIEVEWRAQDRYIPYAILTRPGYYLAGAYSCRSGPDRGGHPKGNAQTQ